MQNRLFKKIWAVHKIERRISPDYQLSGMHTSELETLWTIHVLVKSARSKSRRHISPIHEGIYFWSYSRFTQTSWAHCDQMFGQSRTPVVTGYWYCRHISTHSCEQGSCEMPCSAYVYWLRLRTWARNLRNLAPCNGLVNMSALISSVGQYITPTSPRLILSVIKK